MSDIREGHSLVPPETFACDTPGNLRALVEFDRLFYGLHVVPKHEDFALRCDDNHPVFDKCDPGSRHALGQNEAFRERKRLALIETHDNHRNQDYETGNHRYSQRRDEPL